MNRSLAIGAAIATLAACLTCHPAHAEEPLTPASLTPCPYTAEEIKSALDLTVEKGQPADMSSPGTRDVGCIYPVSGSEVALSVRQTWDPSGSATATAEAKQAANRVTVIPGDPNGATLKASGDKDKDHPDVELSYQRGKVRTSVSVHGGHFRPEDMQPRVLKLKRVP